MAVRRLTIEDLGKRFGDTWVLRNVRARVHPGRITAFIGPNGAGKTTLFHVITGDYSPDEGRVSIDDKDITGWPCWRIARLGIGRQFQDVRVFRGLSVLDNVRIALLPPRFQSPWRAWRHIGKRSSEVDDVNTEALKWIEFVGLADSRNRLASELSFGEQKLLALARLLANGADLLLLDEPTAGLSHGMIDRLSKILRQLVDEKGVTVALIEHNMTVVASLAYWIYFLNEGRVSFTGRGDHVLGNHDVRETYMGIA
jgi:ABC-type branched-subunit amino acid transport system ATPase component